MSASPVARQAVLQAQPKSIPRRVVVNCASELPNDYSTTPGGTLFSTTPGGTRIIYERNFLLQMRNSPLSRTPPKNLPVIPGITYPGKQDATKGLLTHISKQNGVIAEEPEKHEKEGEQFDMDL